MEQYFTDLYFEGSGPAEGRNVLYGYIHFETHLDRNKAHLFPKASRAIRGWTTRAPQRVRDPIPFGVVCLLGLYFLGKGLVGAAVCLALQFDCYLRPDEAVSLLLSSVLPPAPRAGRRFARAWALLLGEAEHAAPTKTGVVDGTVVIGELQRPWVAEAVGLWYRAGGSAPYMFDLTLPKYEALFRQAAFDLGLTDLDISPHGVRHAGASHDMYMGLATLDQIQKRGQWAHAQSVVRYSKHGKILRQVHKMTPEQQGKASAAERDFPSKLLRTLRKC